MGLKKCKGTGKALNQGCGEKKEILRYGLCFACFKNFILNTDAGKEILNKTTLRAKKHVIKHKKQAIREQKKQLRNKSYYLSKLQAEINEIVRLIDIDKPCVSCDYIGTNRQFHAGHYYSVGAYPELRFNLHNIHKQCSICNNHLSGNQNEYRKGLISRYGKDYLKNIENLTKLKSLNITIEDLKDKIEIAREIKKRILKGEDFTRAEINKKIGIYG